MFTVEFEKQSSRKWFVAIGICLLSLAGLGVVNGSLSLYVVPITEALGVARSVYTIYGTVSKICGALLSLVFASIYKKIGAKGVCLMAGLGYIIQLICWSQATSIEWIWIGGAFQGIGYTLSGALVFFAVLPPWFPKSVGTVSGLAAAMSGFSSATVVMIFTNLIANNGYQKALLIQAVIVACMHVVIFFCVANSPDDKAYGKNAIVEEKDKSKSGLAYYKKLFSEPATLMCILIFFLIGVIGYPITSLIVPLSGTRGVTAEVAAAALAIHYVLLSFGKVGAGAVKDLIGTKVLTPVLFILSIATTLMMGFGPIKWYYAVGVIWGFGTVINQIYPPYVMMDAFGKYYDPGFVGAGLAFYQLGRAIGEPCIHIPYDMTGSYSISMVIWTIGWIVLWICVGIMGKLGKKYQEKQEALGIEPLVKIEPKKSKKQAAEA